MRQQVIPSALLLLLWVVTPQGIAANSITNLSIQNTVLKCSKITSEINRLQCFDELAETLKVNSSETKTVVAAPQSNNSSSAPIGSNNKPKSGQSPAEVQTALSTISKSAQTQPTKAQAEKPAVDRFGFEHKISKQPDVVNKLFVEINKVSKDPYGKLVIYLKNGQIWKQTDNTRFSYKAQRGKAYIERGSLGSFFFSQQGVNKRIRVKRSK